MNNEPFFILLADDDEEDRLLFIEAFSELEINTQVQTLNDGVQLMERLNEENLILPHLLFLDLNMPRKNGLECLKEIKSNEKLKNISIAIYSTSANEKDMEESFHHGANIYITKPKDFSLLKQVLNKVIISAFQYQDQSMKKEDFLLRVD